ncbi:hypothetical protein CYMTET_49347 [Cymbomonas tetramitiformis]|uniref:Uncharacterized protein n=1 Tax=Cymbomonas tetramitiformis TaxID=36881 RepID=A0AAE0BS22_9CHLO|nr:hypothetical protein CYMTET_49347 [Cymbomonas tetramitiformis]
MVCGGMMHNEQVEVNMFQATGWKLVEEAGQPVEVRALVSLDRLVVMKRFEFDHALMTMSVVTLDTQDDDEEEEEEEKNEEPGDGHVFCKGSFEKIGELCALDNLPEEYMRRAQALALGGCYVLGMAHRALGKLSREALAGLSREDVERAPMQLLGLVVFRNELKTDSQQAVLDLKAGNVRPIMLTGDNAQCGIHIARACGMVNKVTIRLTVARTRGIQDAEILLGDVVEKSGERTVVWTWAVDESKTTSPKLSHVESTEHVLNILAEEGETCAKELALTGKAFDSLRQSGHMDELLLHTRIFARVSPENKNFSGLKIAPVEPYWTDKASAAAATRHWREGEIADILSALVVRVRANTDLDPP